MDLKTFVAESLKQIAEGIKEAQAADTGAWIAPRVAFTEKKILVITGQLANYAPQLVKFDVAVAATETDSVAGGGGLRVLSLRNH